jgi:hypothetical protein
MLMLRKTLAVLVGVSIIAVPVYAQRQERKKAQIEESGKPRSVSGGVKFQVPKPYEEVYDKSLNYLKRADYAIESAGKDTGQIVTEMTIKGGYSQTGTRIYVVLIKDSDATTTVRVAVSEQKRKKLLQIEPWDDPKVSDKESEKIAADLKAALQ